MKEQDFYQLYRKKTIESGYTPIGRKRFAGVIKTISLIPKTLNHIQGKVNGDSTSHDKALNLDVVSNSKIYIDKRKIFDLLVKALKHGFASYETADAGLEAFKPDIEADWLMKKYL